MEHNNRLNITMFPFLAMGHLIPFLNLAKVLANKGHKISFISTPRNLRRLPKIPSRLSSRITFVTVPFPPVVDLPEEAESSIDIPPSKLEYLKKAFDLLQSSIKSILEEATPTPDWIIYDFASFWLPPLATKLGISHAFFSLFNAATLCYVGPPDLVINNTRDSSRDIPNGKVEDFAVVPKWVPFESTVRYYVHEVKKMLGDRSDNQSGTPDTLRFGLTATNCDVLVIRSSPDFEPEWLKLLTELYPKPVLPLGFLPPVLTQEKEDRHNNKKKQETDNDWTGIKEWLDNQEHGSVVYVSFGTEAILTKNELTELALGLEQCELPFFWVLRSKPSWSSEDILDMLPEGYEERNKGRGVIYTDWAPQVKILSHESIGGALTHCGWNSVIESLGFGRVLIMFPVVNEQGLNSRLLADKKVGMEIVRDEEDGSFTSKSVAHAVRSAMVEKEGEMLRANAKKMKNVFGDRSLNESYIDAFVSYLDLKSTSEAFLRNLIGFSHRISNRFLSNYKMSKD